MKKLIGLILLAVMICSVADGKRISTTRKKLIPIETKSAADTIATEIAPPSAVTLSGYDKPLSSRNETFFATNHLDKTIKGIYITINYTDNDGRQLHKQSRWVDTDIPAGETRQLSIRSWDKQHSFYYRLSKKPRSQATPFSITAAVDYLRLPK